MCIISEIKYERIQNLDQKQVFYFTNNHDGKLLLYLKYHTDNQANRTLGFHLVLPICLHHSFRK
jgi:hypothetical protein